MKAFYLLALTLGLGLIPACSTFPTLPKTELQKVRLAPFAVVGEVTSLDAGIMTMMNPPTVHLKVGLKSEEILAGTNFESKSIKVLYTGYDWDKKVVIGKSYIFLGTQIEGVTSFDQIIPVTPAQISEIKTYLKNEVKIPSDVEFSVTQIKAVKEEKYKNPFGDGKFKVKLYNTGTKNAFIPVVKTASGEIDWAASVGISVDDKILRAEPTKYDVVELPPNRILEGEINTLELKGVDWPSGGSRVYFTFSMGGRNVSNFFYYFSSLHDAMRGE